MLPDPNDPPRRLFVARRTNFCREPDGLAYRLNDRGVVWEAKSRISPVDPLGQLSASDLCLAELLAEGELPASTVFRLGGELGFSPKQLRAAGERLGVSSTRIGFSGKGHWSWSLPGTGPGAACLEAEHIQQAAENGHEKNGESMGMYGESMGNSALVDAPGEEHVEQVSNLLVPPPASPTNQSVQKESEPRMARIGTNDRQGNQDAFDDAEHRDGRSHAERGNKECMGTFGNLCGNPGGMPVAAVERPIVTTCEENARERDRAESRRRRRKAKRNRKKEWKARLAIDEGVSI